MKKKQKKEEEIKLLTNALKDKSLSHPEYLRVQAVLLRKKGYSRKEITDIVGRSLSSLEKWLTEFNKQGIKGLKTKWSNKSSHFVLSRKQKNNIKNIINNNKPKDLGLPGDFWNLETLKQLIKKKYHKEYQTMEAYRKLLHYCGFSYQKVEFTDKRRPDKDKIDHFKKRYQGKLKKGAFSMWW